MEIRNPPDERRTSILPVVQYSVERKITKGKPDYWDYATMLELSVLGRDEDKALDFLSKACACIRENWEPETTARNLRLIREARERQNLAPAWATEIEQDLVKRSAGV
jgi:hypothetical protein